MQRLPLAALEGFVLAARLGNLSRAADQLHLTVSALSHQMRGLEIRLGQRLFVRGSRGVTLTVDGQRLLAGVEQPLAAIGQSVRQCSASSDDALNLSLMPSVASSWLVPRLPDFVARHPEIQINLQSTTALVNFDTDAVDAGLRFGGGQWPGLAADHLFDEWLTPVVHPALAKTLGRTRLKDLSNCPLLGDPGDRWRDWFGQFGGKAPTRFVARFDDSETLHKAASEGLGIALGRMTMARPLIDAGRLQVLTTQRLRAEFAHYFVTPPRSAEKSSVQRFRSWVLAQAAEYVAAVDGVAKVARKK